MHPTLSDHLHPGCEETIRALSSCHADNPLRKFIGACNGAKAALDRCLADEYLVRRELNAEKSKVKKERLRERLRKNNML
jgi:COX assembly mitochondrial protein 2